VPDKAMITRKRARLSADQLSALEDRLISGPSTSKGERIGGAPRPGHESPIVEIQAGGDSPPLFFVHPAGGNILCYVRLAAELGGQRSVYGLQAPGMYGDWKPHSGLGRLAQSYVDAIRTVQAGGPYFLAGWSMGGLIAFEIASQLKAQGHCVALLALLDTLVLTKDPGATRHYEAMFLAGFAQELGISIGEFNVPWQQVLQLGFEEKLDYLDQHARTYAALSDHISPGAFRHLLRVFLTNLQCMFAYSPQRYSGSAVLLRASEQLGEICPDLTGDWTDLAAGGLETVEVPGNHFSMMREPYVRILGARLEGCIRRAEVAGSNPLTAG
jgi:pyochelin synthetase